jgi:hypothetical protein
MQAASRIPAHLTAEEQAAWLKEQNAKLKERAEELKRENEARREDKEVGDVELGDSTFESYQSKCTYFSGSDGAPKSKEHPDKVSETASMHAVALPKPTYAIALPRELLENGLLSTLQVKRGVEDSARIGDLISHSFSLCSLCVCSHVTLLHASTSHLPPPPHHTSTCSL